MQHYQIQVSHEDIERVDTLRYMWGKLREQVSQVQTALLKAQPEFHSSLVEHVLVYQKEVKYFVREYQKVF